MRKRRRGCPRYLNVYLSIYPLPLLFASFCSEFVEAPPSRLVYGIGTPGGFWIGVSSKTNSHTAASVDPRIGNLPRRRILRPCASNVLELQKYPTGEIKMSNRATMTKYFVRVQRHVKLNASVVTVPMSHIGSIRYYDGVLQLVADQLQSVDAGGGHIGVVVEGLCESVEAKELQRAELQRLEADPQLCERTFKAAQSHSLYGELVLRQIASQLMAPFPLPQGLVFQEAYFNPMISCLVPGRITNGDLLHSDLAPPLDSSVAASRSQLIHHSAHAITERRVASCVDTVMAVLRAAPAGTTDSLIVLPWGHHHCEPIVRNLERLGFDSATIIGELDPEVPQELLVAIGERWKRTPLDTYLRDQFG